MAAPCKLCFLFLGVLVGSMMPAKGVDRVWTAKSMGFEDHATLTSVGPDFVVLQPRGSDPKQIPLGDLSNEDQKVIAAVVQCERNAEVYLRVDEHRGRFATSPEAVADLMVALHEMHPGDFAAGFFAGTINAFTRSPERFAKAKKNLNEAISQLKEVRDSFPNLHQSTLAAALNNRGVLALREGSPSQATRFFLEAIEIDDSVPFAVYHNATLLLECAIKAGKSAKLSKGDQTRLTRAVAKASPERPGAKIPRRFVYSLEHDKFESLLKELDGEPNVAGARRPEPARAPAGIEPGFQKLGNGSGFLISGRLAVTNRHVVDALPPGGQVMLKNETSLAGGVVVDVIAISQDDEADLALLRLPKAPANAKPIPLRLRPPRDGEEIAVLGYPVTNVFGETLNSSRGIVSSVSKDGKRIFHDATTNPGNSGGPCLDACGNVLGVCYAAGLGQTAGRNFAVSAAATRAFVASNEKTFAFEGELDLELKLEDRIARSKNAVVRVEIYGRPKQRSSPSDDASNDDHLAQLQTLLQLGLLPELTCLDCNGKGFFPCGCGDGRVSEKRQVLQFKDSATGAEIWDTKVFHVPCPRCSGLAGFKCQSCDKGVLSLFD